MKLEDALWYREDPKRWFQAFGRYRDEETRQPRRSRANVLQRRVFEHYARCQAEKKPCRMVVLKYRRAGSSTAGECLVYMHAHNYNARLGVIGTDYKASSNMLEMLRYYGEHDDFPGWSARLGREETRPISWQEFHGESEAAAVPFEDRVDKIIATKLFFSHGSSVELYTAKNPESARSAGLSGYHATEVGRWPTGGAQDAGETLTAMRNTLPKRGFHLALEESTANGAQGAFYETCRTARWPDYTDWPKLFSSRFPLAAAEYGRDLQFTLIFAAWFEDERHLADLTPEEARRIEQTLDAEAWYTGERELIARFGQEGPQGLRLGGEVNATVWQQLAWRRAIIRTVCTKRGLDEFKQEYPADPLEAFRASGAPALCPEGLIVLEQMARRAKPVHGRLCPQLEKPRWPAWESLGEANLAEASFTRWEEPVEGARYLVTCDPMSGAEAVHGTGEKDRHAVFVIRDKFKDPKGRVHLARVVARIRPPCQWESKPLAREIHLLSLYYGGALIVVEANMGAAVLKHLVELGANLYQREEFDHVHQVTTKRLGWWNDQGDRRIAISELQSFVREQKVVLECPHAVAECATLVINSKGKAVAGGSHHDDDCLALAIGLTCLPWASTYTPEPVAAPEPVDDRKWKDA